MAYCMYIYTIYTVYSMYLCVAVPSTFSTIINFLVGTHLVAVHVASATQLQVASADARLVHKYFSSTKWRAAMLPVVTATYSSLPYTYYTVWHVFDGCGLYF